MTMVLDNCSVNISNGILPQEEVANYVSRGRGKFGARLHGIDIKVDGDYVELRYHVGQVPFQRIRRITGYLVGTMDRWNDSKCAEEGDRVKHSLQ